MSRLARLGSGLGWGGASTVIVAAFQLVFMAVMARLLEPADFGLVAVANVALRFLNYFAQMGVGSALVQKPELERGDIAAAFSVSIAVSLFCTLLAMLLAGFAGRFFSMPDLPAVIRWLSLGFVLSGMGTVANGLLRRDMHFKRLAINDAVAYVFGYGGIGIAMAVSGMGVWALVGASLSQTLLTAGLGYLGAQHPIAFVHGRAQRNHFLAFGGKYSLIGFLEFLGSNFDAMLIGKTLGDSAAGLYNRALLLANLPVEKPANVLSRALFPVLSSLGSQQRDKYAIGLQISVIVTGSYAFAVAGGISAAAPELVAVLLGEKWAASAAVTQILALSVGPLFVSHICGVTFDALGALGVKLKIQGGALLGLICGLMFALPYGLTGIATVIMIVESFKMLASLVAAASLLSIGRAVMLRIVATVLVFGGSSWGAVQLAAQLVHGFEHDIVRLAFEVAAGASGLILSFGLCRYLLASLQSVQWLLSRFPRLSRVFQST
ncbi:lipopolysaccharide biosynthesis protein [Thauera sinica]|uniref:Lipopolysaccharide biosynthesis protein n=1 Tax=Thauera sinica TaxID=2665146 RepID=A0ABW1ANK8_9RHOO|nr:lipopolysaccharide biosynthesis protein [Thauera sp. K11]ATE60535.1 hypothetical protein CCZ27_11780 [Thauera sp. K11]